MASNINPYNINGNYPVAGQDNDSQGFRDNFTNIRNNLVFTKAELEDLQSKVLLKTSLTGKSVEDSDFNNLNYQPLKLAQLRGWSETVVQTSATSIIPATCSFLSGNVHKLTITGDVDIDLVDLPNYFTKMTLWITATDNSTATLKIDSSAGINWKGGEHVKDFDYSNSILSFPTAGDYLFEISGVVPGESTTYIIKDVTRVGTIGSELTVTGPLLLGSSEDVASTNIIDLGVTASYFSTDAAETATLPAGAEGQIKTLAMYADTGDMVVTVTNAGWKASGTGTITFDNIGEACTLQYINSKWFCIGNNGATFA